MPCSRTRRYAAKGGQPTRAWFTTPIAHVFTYQGIDGLMTLQAQTEHRFHYICTAVLFEDLLRMIRVWGRLGYKPDEIQSELDVRYVDVMLLRPKHEPICDPGCLMFAATTIACCRLAKWTAPCPVATTSAAPRQTITLPASLPQ